MDEQGRCLLSKVCKRKQGTVDIPGKFNPISYKRSLRGEPIEAVKEEVRALVSGKEGVVVFAEGLDVDLLDLGPESCQVIDVQEHFNARGRQELGMATKTLPPFPSGGKYSLKNLSRAVLGRRIQEGRHQSLEDATATMDLFQWGRDWILPEVVSNF